MDDNQENRPKIVPPIPLPTHESLLTETFEIHANPTIDEVVRLMARLANFLNLHVAESLRARIVTAAQPAPMAMLNAAATLEAGAIQQRQYLVAMAQGQGTGFAAPGGPGGGIPPGAPPFRMN